MDKFKFDDSELEINFDEFDEVIVKTVTTEFSSHKSDEEDFEEEFSDEDFEDITFDEELPSDVGVSVSVDDVDDIDDADDLEDESDEIIEDEPEDNFEELDIEECTKPENHRHYEGEHEEEVPMDESSKPSKGKSLASFYEARKQRKANKLVESLLVDNVVSTIEQSLKSVLDAAGISRAQSIVVIGMILDRMLRATDAEVSAPEYLSDVIGDVIDDSSIQSLVKSAVEQALEDPDHPAPAPASTEVTITSKDTEILEDSEKKE